MTLRLRSLASTATVLVSTVLVSTVLVSTVLVITAFATPALATGPAAAPTEHHTVCGQVHRAHEVVVDISRQRAWLCRRDRQVLTTPVTTGAVRRGDGTPTGRWRIYAKQRNTTLYPAGGGAYRVHYWMPYSGPYGLHDAPWQHFPYGSGKYRSHGSHGCVHVPLTAMRFLFHWAPVGTTVLVRR